MSEAEPAGACTICGDDHEDGHPFRRYTCRNDECDNEVWLPYEEATNQLWCASCSPETGYAMDAELGPGSVVKI